VTSKALAKKIALSALEKKADDIVIMDLRKLTTMTDYFVVCSADSDTQVKAIADSVREGAREVGESVWRNEGYSDASWILLDYVDVVVHVFHKQTREFYALEELWTGAKLEHVTDEEPAEKPASVKKPAARVKKETTGAAKEKGAAVVKKATPKAKAPAAGKKKKAADEA
jgi:ribosome-associated protein